MNQKNIQLFIDQMKIFNAHYVESALQFKDLSRSRYPEIAFIGRSNVGKSSLINVLVERKNLAQISKKPGKTRTINIFQTEVEIDKVKRIINYADLPGYGFARTPTKMLQAWKHLIERYIFQRENLVGLILLIDIRHDADPKDIDAIKWISSSRKPFLLVATKADKLNKSEINLQKRRFKDQFLLLPDQPISIFSAKNKMGKNQILRWISDQVSTMGGEEVCY